MQRSSNTYPSGGFTHTSGTTQKCAGVLGHIFLIRRCVLSAVQARHVSVFFCGAVSGSSYLFLFMQPSSQRLCMLLVCHLFICRHLYGGKELSHILTINIKSMCLIRSELGRNLALACKKCSVVISCFQSSVVQKFRLSLYINAPETILSFSAKDVYVLCFRDVCESAPPHPVSQNHFVPTRGSSSFSFVQPQSGVEPS